MKRKRVSRQRGTVSIGIDQSYSSTGVVILKCSETPNYVTATKYIISDPEPAGVIFTRIVCIANVLAGLFSPISADVGMVVFEEPAQGGKGNASRLSMLLGAMASTVSSVLPDAPIIRIVSGTAKCIFFGKKLTKDETYVARFVEAHRRKFGLPLVEFEPCSLKKDYKVQTDLIDAYLNALAGWYIINDSAPDDPSSAKAFSRFIIKRKKKNDIVETGVTALELASKKQLVRRA